MVKRTRTMIAPRRIMRMPRVRCRMDKLAGEQMWCSLGLIAWLPVGKLLVALLLSKNKKHDDLLNICVIITKIGHYCQTPPEIHWAALMPKPCGARTEVPSVECGTNAAPNDVSLTLSLTHTRCSMLAKMALLWPPFGCFCTAPVKTDISLRNL